MFGEDQARYLIAADAPSAGSILTAAREAKVPAAVIGLAGGRFVSINGGHAVDLIRLKQGYETWMPTLMAGEPEAHLTD